MKDGSQEQGISNFIEEERKDIKRYLSQHFETDDTQESRNKLESASNNQVCRPSPSLDYRCKMEETR